MLRKIVCKMFVAIWVLLLCFFFVSFATSFAVNLKECVVSEVGPKQPKYNEPNA